MYFEQALKEFYEDGVQYIEIKTTSTSEEFLIQHQNFVDNFKSKYADFIGVKLIIGGRRSATNQRDIVNKTLELMKKYPNLIKGFDLLSHAQISCYILFKSNIK
uniref:Uncharacterized protein n=1 Tax=Biomphalaria glabrata TaxID=6526 RepID=A0A2C9KUM2_BIOGL